MKYAVTSVSGNLGNAIAQQLIKDYGNDSVIGFARTPSKANNLKIPVFTGDYNNKEDFLSVLNPDIDALVLISGMDTPEKQIIQHRNIINAVKESGVKKIVYTSIIGETEGMAFSPIVACNRQTEDDIKNSGLDWVIGRNGLYIEPDLESIEIYKAAGKIINCAGDGKCGYTTRNELAYAYSKMLCEDKHNGRIYNLFGEKITQSQLAELLNKKFDLSLEFENVSVEEYRKERQAEHGEFLGTIIAGIYEGIQKGYFDKESHYQKAAGKPHITWEKFFEQTS